MFSLFGNGRTKAKIIDRVFISFAGKEHAVLERIRSQPNLIIVVWFEENYNQVENLLASNNLHAEIYMAKEVAGHHVQNKAVLFFGHYPLLTKENEVLAKLQLKKTVFYSSLDEPLFMHFGGERIAHLMQVMGLPENEAVEHPMITSAIKNAQEKISKEIVVEHLATSQSDWFSKNIVK